MRINGRYDRVCPPIAAYKPHQALPTSKQVIAESFGHWMGEPNIEKELLKAMGGGGAELVGLYE